MIPYPQINPTIIKIGFLEIRWYGLLYIVSFILGYIFLKKLFAMKNIKITKDKYDSFLFYIMIGVIVGGRLGYILFYNLSYYITNPLHILTVWEGGMSFHGGAIAVVIMGFVFCHKYNYKFYQLADPVMPMAAIGLFLGRIGNFINAELYGRVTNLPWGMIFPGSDDGLPRHPSQLYEAFFEGLVLFLITYLILKKIKKQGLVFWIWIALYGVFRFLIEFVREPDAHLGYIFWFFTMGQILCAIMIITSIIAITILLKKHSENEISEN